MLSLINCWIHFGSILEPKMAPTSIKNRSTNQSNKSLILSSILNRFLNHFQHDTTWPRARFYWENKWFLKIFVFWLLCCCIDFLIDFWSIFNRFYDRCLIIFGSFLDRCLIDFGQIFNRFWTISGSILDRYGVDLGSILERIRIDFKSFNVRVINDISIDFGLGPRGGGYAALLRFGSAAPGL